MVNVNSLIKAAAPGCHYGVIAIKIKDKEGLKKAIEFLKKLENCHDDYIDMLEQILEKEIK